MYVSVSTNGTFINDKNIDEIFLNAPDKLIFSIDGLDEATYQVYRVGGTFKQADSGLRALISKKKQKNSLVPFIELQFIVMQHNEHQLEEVIKYGKNIGVDKITFKTMQVSTVNNAKKFLPSQEKYTRYKVNDLEVKLKHKLKNHCFALWRTSVVTWDGKIVPCCFDKDAEYIFGTIITHSFKEIWKSSSYNLFRKRILDSRKEINICNNCTEGLKMNILEVEN
jgi:radical SAM protein with 4Fe4S-binding SPASM domain